MHLQPTTTMFILDLSDKDQNGSEYLAELEAYRALDTFEWNSTSYAGRLSRVSNDSSLRAENLLRNRLNIDLCLGLN